MRKKELDLELVIEEAVNARESAKRKYGFHENHC